MKVKYIFLGSILLFAIGFLVHFESIKDILRNHLPFHTKAYVQQIIQDRRINYTKKDQATFHNTFLHLYSQGGPILHLQV